MRLAQTIRISPSWWKEQIEISCSRAKDNLEYSSLLGQKQKAVGFSDLKCYRVGLLFPVFLHLKQLKTFTTSAENNKMKTCIYHRFDLIKHYVITTQGHKVILFSVMQEILKQKPTRTVELHKRVLFGGCILYYPR